MFALPISKPRFKSIISFIKIALKLSYFWKKMLNFQALGAPPPGPGASGGWGLCPQTPRPPKQPPHCQFLPTRLTVCAVHSEIFHSLTTDSLINALRRFIARRGAQKHISRTTGPTLWELPRSYGSGISTKSTTIYANKRFNRRLIPHRQSQWSTWERMTISVRRILSALFEEVLQIAMTESGWIINSRHS